MCDPAGTVVTSSALSLTIDGGTFGHIAIHAPSPTNAISIRILDKEGDDYLTLQDENITCTLTIDSDGAVNTLSIEGKGRWDIGFASRSTDERGQLVNSPTAALDGETNDLPTIWRRMTQLDRRFLIPDNTIATRGSLRTGSPQTGRQSQSPMFGGTDMKHLGRNR